MASMQSWADEIKFFKGTFEQAIKQAETEKKLLFVDVYTDWCGPCKTMVKNVFTHDEVADYYNRNFINFKLNAEDEDGNRVALAERYDVKAYPTLLYLTADGEVRSKAVGGLSVERFIAQGRTAIDGEQDFEPLMARYKAGESGQMFMEELLTVGIGKLDGYSRAGEHEKANEFGESLVVIAEQYFADLPKKDWPSSANITILSRLMSIRGIEHPVNQYAYQNPKMFYGFDDATIAKYLSNFHISEMLGKASAGDKAYRNLLAEILSERHYQIGYAGWGEGIPVVDASYRIMKAYAEIAYFASQNDWGGFMDSMDDMHQLRGDSFLGSPDFPNMARQLVDGGCLEEDLLHRLNEYAHTSYKVNPVYNYQSGMIHAELMARLGNMDEAKAVISDMKKAFSEFGERGKSYIKDMDALLEKIG